MARKMALVTAMCALVLGVTRPADAAAILPVAGFTTTSLAANDDGSTGLVGIGFGLNFYGVNFSNLYVNNNGNVTFNNPLGEYTPTGITGGTQPTLAPFWADVDTRTAATDPPTNLVTYGNGLVDGHNAFGVDWIGVGYYAQSPTSARNSFQLVVIDRSDIAPGDFDFMFNYDQIQFESGQASGSDVNGCGGSPAHAGWTNGSGTFAELPGSGTSGAFTDAGFCGSAGGPFTLTTHSLNSNVAGQYIFNVRSGEVVPPPVSAVPEPGSLLLLGTGVSFLARRALRKQSPRS